MNPLYLMELTGIWNIYKGKGKIYEEVQYCINRKLSKVTSVSSLFAVVSIDFEYEGLIIPVLMKKLRNLMMMSKKTLMITALVDTIL